MNQDSYSATNGKVAVIIGALGTLGKNFQRHLERREWITLGLDIMDLDAHCDINDPHSIKTNIQYIHNRYKRIDVVINATYPRNRNYGKSFFDIDIKDFNENVNLHLGGAFLVMQKFSEYFTTQGFGNIINIGSIYGVGVPKFKTSAASDRLGRKSRTANPPEYAAIKSGIIQLTKYAAKYLQSQNIRVNCISPGGISENSSKDETFLKEYKKECINKGILDARDLNSALDFLLADGSKFINGQNIIIDDGWSL